MHKKLLIAMLVPILAFSLVVVGCGSDDGPVDGDFFPSFMQGAFHNLSATDDRWIVMSGNQVTVFDSATYSSLFTFRTEFALLGGPAFLDFPGILRQATLNQEKVIQRMARELFTAAWTPAAWVDLQGMGTSSHVLIEQLHLFDGDLSTDLGRAQFNLILNNVAFWDVLDYFSDTYSLINRAFMAGGTPVEFCHQTFSRAPGARQVMGDFIGATTPQFFTETGLGTIPSVPASFPGVIFGSEGDVADFGANEFLAQRILPFRITYFDYHTSEVIGYNDGFWVNPVTEEPGYQFLIITQRNFRRDVQDEVLPEVGVWLPLSPNP